MTIYFHKNIKHLRNSLGISQNKLGEMLGIKRGRLASYERGVSYPEMPTMLKLCNFFKTDPTTLLYTDMSVLGGVGARVELMGGEKAKPAANRVGDADGLKQCHEQVAALQREMALKDEIIALLKDKVKDDK